MNPDTALSNVSKSQFSHLYNRKNNTCPADSGVYGLLFIVNKSFNGSLESLNTCEDKLLLTWIWVKMFFFSSTVCYFNLVTVNNVRRLYMENMKKQTKPNSLGEISNKH